MTIQLSLIDRSACEVVDMLRSEAISPHDLLDTLAAQMDRVEPHVNALPIVCWERAHEHADALLRKPVAERGLLCGLPVPIKDLSAVKGVRTTYGSRVYEDFVPGATDATPTRIEASGGIVYAKSNTPEFGAGAHTINKVLGLTRNPWKLSRSAGGSSGGAAAALASGTAWVAHGSDLAGSLRTPAAFCGVVGLRPTPGRLASGPAPDPFDTMAVQGPMARNVADTALLFDAMCGTDSRAPLSMPNPPTPFLDHALRPRKPARVGYSPGLGIAEAEPEILAICATAMDSLGRAGIDIDLPTIDLSKGTRAFHVLRGVSYATYLADELAAHRGLLNPNVIGNIEYGLSLDGPSIAEAQRTRGALFHQMMALLDEYEVVICPASIVPPFPVEETYVASAAGRQFSTYIDWLAITYGLTLLGLPVISIPCGMTSDGLPVGIQIAGRPRGEAALLSVAAAIEAIIGKWATQERELDSLMRTNA
ncbi:TPA: amidase [Burkholderia lata]